MGLGLHRIGAQPLSAAIMRSRQPMSDFLPEPVGAELLRQVALAAIEAATQAGASYADIRIADARRLDLNVGDTFVVPMSYLTFDYSYGVRVLVDGTWGFAYGAGPTVDSVTRAARSAVSTARGIAKFSTPCPPLVPVPVAKGEWATPVQVDPFAISPDEHAKTLNAYRAAGHHILDKRISFSTLRFQWWNQTRVFASSEGSLLTQRLTRAMPQVEIWRGLKYTNEGVNIPLTGFRPRGAGYETVVGPELQESIKQNAEEIVRLSNYPIAQADVGRYPALLDGQAISVLASMTLSRALEIRRVLGHDADGTGTSVLAPANEMLGKQVLSPHMTITTDRSVPEYGAAKWDDEGVATEPFTLIDKGTVVDYFTTRATGSVLAEWYAKRGKPLTTHGSAVAWSPTVVPNGVASSLRVQEDTNGKSLDAMTKEMGTGLLFRGVRGAFGINGMRQAHINTDQQLSGGSYLPMMMYEVKRGAITRRLMGGMMQFRTLPLFKSITAVGNASTLEPYTHGESLFEALDVSVVPVMAPAAHVPQVDITQFEKTL